MKHKQIDALLNAKISQKTWDSTLKNMEKISRNTIVVKICFNLIQVLWHGFRSATRDEMMVYKNEAHSTH